jgi:hypothetical protein
MSDFAERLIVVCGGISSGVSDNHWKVLAQGIEDAVYSAAVGYESYCSKTTLLSEVPFEALTTSYCALAGSFRAAVLADCSCDDVQQRLQNEQALTEAFISTMDVLCSDEVARDDASVQSGSDVSDYDDTVVQQDSNASDAEPIARLCTTVISADDSGTTSVLSCESEATATVIPAHQLQQQQ